MQRYTWLQDLPELGIMAKSLPVIAADTPRLFLRQLKVALAPRVQAALGGLKGAITAAAMRNMNEQKFVRSLAEKWNKRQREIADAAQKRRDIAGANAIYDSMFASPQTLTIDGAVREAQVRGLLRVEEVKGDIT